MDLYDIDTLYVFCTFRGTRFEQSYNEHSVRDTMYKKKKKIITNKETI